MRTLNKNKQRLFYANQDRIVPIYEYYEDEEGNLIPLDTGETKLVYGEPIEFKGNIAMSSNGEVEIQEFGLDVSAYDAILIVQKDYVPISETTLIWFENPIIYDDEIQKVPNEFSADYRVLAVKPSLNSTKYVLGRLVK
jgi:hypothetical protein